MKSVRLHLEPLLDTDVLITFSRGREPAASRFLALLEEGNEVAICPVTVAEYYAGVERGDDPQIDRFIDALPYWGITSAAAITAGHYRYTFARQGRPLSTADTLIAAVATRHRATVLTRNARDFPMKDVSVLEL